MVENLAFSTEAQTQLSSETRGHFLVVSMLIHSSGPGDIEIASPAERPIPGGAGLHLSGPTKYTTVAYICQVAKIGNLVQPKQRAPVYVGALVVRAHLARWGFIPQGPDSPPHSMWQSTCGQGACALDLQSITLSIGCQAAAAMPLGRPGRGCCTTGQP